MKKLVALSSIALLMATASPALAQDNLVEVTLEEGFVVEVPVGIAATVCDENPGVIAKQGKCTANPDKLPIKVPPPFL